MNTSASEPSGTQLAARLGKAIKFWTQVVELVSDNFKPIDQVWKSSKIDFLVGYVC